MTAPGIYATVCEIYGGDGSRVARLERQDEHATKVEILSLVGASEWPALAEAAHRAMRLMDGLMGGGI